MFIDLWLEEMSTSALSEQVKKYGAYLTLASIGQAQQRTFRYKNRQNYEFDLTTPGIISISSILSGKPGSYKSELVRFIGRVLDATGECNIYPHDQVSREYLLSTLYEQQQLTARNGAAQSKLPADFVYKPLISTILIDELINFLNRREYVEPLVGTLNAILDQPSKYATGTHKRGTELLRRPICNVIAACAPSWFKYLPEALFTGGATGRISFYGVPYPRDEDRQPRGQICVDKVESPKRLAQYLKEHLPPGPLILEPDAISQYDKWEMEWGKEDAHPLEAIDEWYKRRVIQCTRTAGSIAMSMDRTNVTLQDMYSADEHMKHIQTTLEYVWFEIDSDAATQHRMLQIALAGKPLRLDQIEQIAIKHMRSVANAQRIIEWWMHMGLMVRSKEHEGCYVLFSA